MDGRKIIICTTFREFNGNSNDEIQRLFLRSLRNQTYQNFIVAPTIFTEKNTESVLEAENIPFKAFYSNAGKYRYSHSKVVENAITLIDKPNSYILIWTCSDDLFERDFLEKIVASMTPLSCCTSLPHIGYRNVDEYLHKKVFNYTYGGIDLICFDGDIFLNQEARKVIRDFPNLGQNMIEYFLSGVGRVFSKRMFNMWPIKIERINNDRKANNETREFITMCTTRNQLTYESFKTKYKLKGDVYRSVLSFKTPIRYFKVRFMIYFMITKCRLQHILIRDWMFKMIPVRTKKLLKRIIGKKINDVA